LVFLIHRWPVSGGFGGALAAGCTIVIDGVTREIAGVVPRGFRLVEQDFDFVVPPVPSEAARTE
jgi:hypothetical protein